MGNRVVTPTIGVRLDDSRTSAQGAEHSLGYTVMIHTSGDGDGTSDRKIAVYGVCEDIVSTSVNCTILAGGSIESSAGGYVALGSGNIGDFIWVRSSANIA